MRVLMFFMCVTTQDYEGRDVDVTINPWSGHISAATALMTAIHVSNIQCVG